MTHERWEPIAKRILLSCVCGVVLALLGVCVLTTIQSADPQPSLLLRKCFLVLSAVGIVSLSTAMLTCIASLAICPTCSTNRTDWEYCVRLHAIVKLRNPVPKAYAKFADKPLKIVAIAFTKPGTCIVYCEDFDMEFKIDCN